MKLAGRVALISGGGAAGSAARFLAPSLRHAPSGPLRHDAAEEETAFLVSNAGARQSPGRATLPKNRMSGSRPKLPIRHLVGSTFW